MYSWDVISFFFIFLQHNKIQARVSYEVKHISQLLQNKERKTCKRMKKMKYGRSRCIISKRGKLSDNFVRSFVRSYIVLLIEYHEDVGQTKLETGKMCIVLNN